MNTNQPTNQPFEPEVILKKFNTRQPTLGSSDDSDSSALSASNWRKTEGLLRQVVKDRRDPRAQKLSQAFHRISVQKSLLEHEAQGLRQALTNERLRRKRGKALPLEQPNNYHGGSYFYSPTKVEKARELLRQQELEEEQQQLQKAEKARYREDQKQAKAQAIEARRKARAEATILRQAEKAREAADRASRAAARRTQQRLKQAQKTSQKGKRLSLKASYKAASTNRAAAQAQDNVKALGAAAGPPPSQSRHGRLIKLPAKYR
jgi:membrane protein involved in colicin uptake